MNIRRSSKVQGRGLGKSRHHAWPWSLFLLATLTGCVALGPTEGWVDRDVSSLPTTGELDATTWRRNPARADASATMPSPPPFGSPTRTSPAARLRNDDVRQASLDATPAQDPDRPPAPAPPGSPAALAVDDGLIPAGDTPSSIPQATTPQPIDLPAALRLADRQNPEIGEARVIILEALAARQNAYALLLPTFNTGTNYHDHVGVLQRASGTILPVTEQSLYVGSGARTLAAESNGIPGVNIFSPLTDAIFEPLAAQQRVRGVQANAVNVANVTLLEVARLYFQLLGAQAAYEARKVTAKEADQIAASVRAFATTGQGRRSDAERAETDRRLLQTDILRAEEQMAVTAARLAERLNLDPSSRLQPTTGTVDPIELIDPNVSVEDLIQAALARRPDLENRRALVAEASYQVREERFRPLLPTIWISFSGGAFGGGSNIVPPTFSAVAGRTDFDARAYWTVLNFGAGNVSRIRQRQALANQAVAAETRAVNEIRAQVATARSQSLAFKARIVVARERLRTADDGFAQDRSRLRETLAKPIEALDSLRLLAEARVALIEAITEFNQVQFDLFVSLGAPPPLG